MPHLLALLVLLFASPALALDPLSFNPAANDLPKLVGRAFTDQLEELAVLVDTQPMAVANTLERDSGGRGAILRYAAAMLDTGQADRLATQTVLVLRAGNPNARIHDILGQGEEKDGGTWFPRAEEAGYFLGGVAVAVSRDSARAEYLEAQRERLRREPMPEAEPRGPWRVVSTTRADGEALDGAAMEWFEKGFDAASR